MEAFLSGQALSHTVAAPDTGATAYAWRLLDQHGAVLAPLGEAIDLSDPSEVVIAVPAELNTLAEGTVRALRSLEVHFTTDSGIVRKSLDYLIESEQTVVPVLNSFQTHGEAVLNSYDMVFLDGWSSAIKTQQNAALVSAWRNIGQLRFRYLFDDNQDHIEPTSAYTDLTMITEATWAAMPADFKEALKRAQLYQADFLLAGGDSAVDAKRRSGIISETIGESSMFLRSGKPIDRPVCARALKELSKYLLNRTRISRT